MSRGQIEVDQERCKGCGLCIEACPQNIIDFSGEINSNGYEYVEPVDQEKCLGCAFCATQCPDVAITVYELKEAGV